MNESLVPASKAQALADGPSRVSEHPKGKQTVATELISSTDRTISLTEAIDTPQDDEFRSGTQNSPPSHLPEQGPLHRFLSVVTMGLHLFPNFPNLFGLLTSRSFLPKGPLPELDRLQQRIKDNNNRILQETEKIEALRRYNDDLEAEHDSKTAELKSLRTALSSARTFTHREGAIDAQALIQDLEDLNTVIQDLSYKIVCGLDTNLDALKLEPQHYDAASEIVGNLLFLEEMKRLSLSPMEVVDPIVRFILCTALVKAIFNPYSPGLSLTESEYLSHLYADMRGRRQPQERCAHWRSITYTAACAARDYTRPPVEQEASPIEKDVNLCITTISNVVNILTDSNIGIDIDSEYRQDTMDIFLRAIQLQKKAKTEYLSYDYIVGDLSIRDLFDGRCWEVFQGHTEVPAKSVWLPIGLGMVAERNAVKGGTIEIEPITLSVVKIPVICDNWEVVYL